MLSELKMADSALLERPPLHRNDPNDFGLEIPYFDEELGVGHLGAHELAVRFFGNALNYIARRLGLVYHSDYPVRYFNHRQRKQKQYYPDFHLAKAETPERVIADDLLLALEVVSITDRRKEIKDTIIMPALNEYNRVGEFVLYFPDVEDERTLIWRRLDRKTGKYFLVGPDADGFYVSANVPELRMRVLPREEWESGRKIEIFLGAEFIPEYEQLIEEVEQAREEVEQERLRAERAEREAERIRDEAAEQIEQERRRADQEHVLRLKLEAELKKRKESENPDAE